MNSLLKQIRRTLLGMYIAPVGMVPLWTKAREVSDALDGGKQDTGSFPVRQ